MRTTVASSLAAVFLLVALSSVPAQAFQGQHPKSHKVAKHRTKGDHRHHFFFKKKKH